MKIFWCKLKIFWSIFHDIFNIKCNFLKIRSVKKIKKMFPCFDGPAWHEYAFTCSGTFSSEWKVVQAIRDIRTILNVVWDERLPKQILPKSLWNVGVNKGHQWRIPATIFFKTLSSIGQNAAKLTRNSTYTASHIPSHKQFRETSRLMGTIRTQKR